MRQFRIILAVIAAAIIIMAATGCRVTGAYPMQVSNPTPPPGSVGTDQLQNNAVTDAKAAALGRMQFFAASGTFTAPKTGDYLVRCIGGGGGGGQGDGQPANTGNGTKGGSGGSGGAENWAVVALNQGDVVTVTIGAGGAGGNVGSSGVTGAAGANGGATSFGAYLTAAGGYGGQPPGGGANGNIVGSQGMNGGGQGGGQGGAGANSTVVGTAGGDGTGYGSGGGGGGGLNNNPINATTGGIGGTGTAGMCLVTW